MNFLSGAYLGVLIFFQQLSYKTPVESTKGG